MIPKEGTVDFSGAWVTLTTPFTADGDLSRSVLAEQVRFLRAHGCRRLIPGGNTGEYFSLTPHEVLACVETTRAAAPDALVLAGVGGELGSASELAREVISAGADGIMIHHPVQPFVGWQGLRDYYRSLLERADGKAILYKRSHAVPDDLLTDLLRDGEAWGVKYAVNDLAAFAAAVAEVPEAAWICGTAELWAPFFALAGACGFTSGLANAAPRITAMMEAALQTADFALAMEIRELARPFEELRAENAAAKNVPAVRAAARLAGFEVGDPRPPISALGEHDLSRVRQIWHRWEESGIIPDRLAGVVQDGTSKDSAAPRRAARPGYGRRILLIDPTSPGLLREQEEARLRRLVHLGTRVEVTALHDGPPAIQTSADEALAARGVAKILEGAASRYDAVVVCCTLDVGVGGDAAIPVIGPGWVGMRIAASIGGRFAVAVATSAGVADMRLLAKSYGFDSELVSVVSLGIPIVEQAADLPVTARAIAEAARATAADGARSLVIGCTAASAAVELAAGLLAGDPQVPVLIDPLACAVLCAEATAAGIDAGLPGPRPHDCGEAAS